MRSRTILTTAVFTSLLLLCWAFPPLWYTRSDRDGSFFWLEEKTAVPGWHYEPVPVAKSAEAALVADKLVSGEFSTSNMPPVRVFSAKRYRENQNEIGLFVHTPDRCWTESGWKLEPVEPDLVEVPVHGVTLRFERRIFAFDDRRELVYFCGLVGGQPLPYRLDHNLSVGMKMHARPLVDKTGTAARAYDSRLWGRVWDAFLSRRRLLGPKQFLRISTPIAAEQVTDADERLRAILPGWLSRVQYERNILRAQTQAR